MTTIDSPTPDDVARSDAADDLALCVAVRGGDQGAFDALYRRHVDWATAIAVGMVGRHNADDLVSETFAALLSALRRGLGPLGGLRAYLRTAMRRQAGKLLAPTDEVVPSDGLSLLLAEGDDPTAAGLDPLMSAEDVLMASSDQETAVRAFHALRPRSRRAIELVDLHGLSYRDAARDLEVSLGTFGRALFVARHELFDAWVAEHVPDADHPERHPSRLDLAQHLTRSSGERVSGRTRAHLLDCADCRRRLDLVDVVPTQPRRRTAALGWLGLIPLWWARTRRSARSRHLLDAAPWLGSTSIVTGLAVVLIATLTTAIPVSGWSSEPTAGSTVSAAGSTSAGAAPPGALSAISVHWTESTDLATRAVGDEVVLTFRIDAVGEDDRPATLTIAAATGVELVQPYSFCSTDVAGLSCPRLGPFADGQSATGQVMLRVLDPATAQAPTLAITRD